MKRIFLYAVVALCTILVAQKVQGQERAVPDAAITPYDLTVETMPNPVGLDEPAPRLAWKSQAVSENSWNHKQTAYQVLVASSWQKLASDEGDLWDSGKIDSEDSINIAYAGMPLGSSRQYWWKVRVWDENGKDSAWSDPGHWITGIMTADDWHAKWIAQPEEYRADYDLTNARWISLDNGEKDAFVVRREFTIDQSQEVFDNKDLFGVLRYAGNKRFELFVNGHKVGFSIGMVFNPNQLRALDISEYLVPGNNVVAAAVTNDGEDPSGFLANVELHLLDKSGNEESEQDTRRGTPLPAFFTLNTDESWSVAPEGKTNWNTLGDQESAWAAASVLFAADDGPWGKVRRHTESVTPRFQKKFTLTKDVLSATLNITGVGYYEASLNGHKIGDKVLDPAPSKFNKTVYYSTYDLSEEMIAGMGQEQELDVLVGHGWYDMRTIATWNYDASDWRSFPRMIAQLDVVYEDGTAESIISDESWTFATSSLVYDCIRQGCIIDACAASEKKILGQAVCVDGPGGKLTASSFPASKITEEFQPKSISEPEPGVYVVDLGRNIAGWCRIAINGAHKGDAVRFQYSERVLDNGRLDAYTLAHHFMAGSMSNLIGQRGFFQTDFYRCCGEDGEVFEPKFVYHGFQFVEIIGLREAPKLEDITACIVHTDFQKAGSFSCSNELMNKIQAATLLSYRGNYVNSYPTDCPHREKNGWTGDANLAVEQAVYNWENTAAYEKWIQDLRDEQQEDGNLAAIVPTGGWGYAWGNGPAWDSALVTIPWTLYLYRGDLRILEKNYEAMKKYVDYMTTRATDSLVSHGLGDWVPAKTETPVVVTSTGYYYIDTLIVAQTAKLLGLEDDARTYFELAMQIRSSFLKSQIKEDGTCSNGSQTAQSTALHQGFASVLDSAEQQKIFDKLVAAIDSADKHLDFGIFGSKYVYRTLSDFGRTDLALTMILQPKRPCMASWINHGEGTLWEDWGDGASRNHIMFGDVSAWFYQSLGGIRVAGSSLAAVADPAVVQTHSGHQEQLPAEVVATTFTDHSKGFKNFVIAPQCRKSDVSPDGFAPITWVSAEVESPYGPVKSAWKWNDGMTELTLNVTVPVGTTASVILPFKSGSVSCVKGNPQLGGEGERGTMYLAGSGNYEFIVKP
ncbi:MAG: family 78 glycoside hydrolase catalytic domain [Planctomycetia bacterium]|nr:family 78 glycoside hydrolase catalytic domain [Planctomycetia bacterium]